MTEEYERDKKLAEATQAFRLTPTIATAGKFLAQLMENEAEGELDDDEWLDGLGDIRDFLIGEPA